jgi:hypothetical protein
VSVCHLTYDTLDSGVSCRHTVPLLPDIIQLEWLEKGKRGEMHKLERANICYSCDEHCSGLLCPALANSLAAEVASQYTEEDQLDIDV